MIRNYRGVFGWQGNKLGWLDWFPYLFIGLVILSLIALFIFKNVIRARFERGGKILFFKSDLLLWRIIGVIGLIAAILRFIAFWVLGYPLYWENLNLHFCRLHIWLMFLFLAIGKKEWLKYFTNIVIIGVFFALFFGHERSDFLNSDLSLPDYQSQNPGFKGPTIFEQLMVQEGMNHYSVGLDNYWLYDFFFSHWLLVTLPMFLRCAYAWKYTNKQLVWTLIVYLGIHLFMWIFNVVFSEIPNLHWKANNWYTGRNEYNDYKDALGPLTAWPQNFISFPIIGLVAIFLTHLFWMWQNKFNFFKNKRFFLIQKSDPWIDSKKELQAGSKSFWKDVFTFRKRN